MARRLITNADDFGLTHGINRAIAELHDAGALTSATLMATGPAFKDAVALARQRPTLGVGCHILLTDGLPVCPPRSIPSLLARDGHSLRPKLLSFLAALITHQIDPDEIEREAVAQIQRIQEAGLTVTHLDAHKHTHIAPPVMSALLRAALRTGVHAIRNPFEQPWAFPLSNGTTARTSQIRLLQPMQRSFLRRPEIQSGQMHTTDGTVGISATGNLDEPTLRKLLEALPDGTWELVCHPGYNDAELSTIATRLRSSREVELHALLAVFSGSSSPQVSGSAKPALDETSPETEHLPPLELIHYASLAVSPTTASPQREAPTAS